MIQAPEIVAEKDKGIFSMISLENWLLERKLWSKTESSAYGNWSHWNAWGI